MKKSLMTVFLSILVYSLFSPIALARQPSISPNITKEYKREEMEIKITEKAQERQEVKKNLLENIKDKIKGIGATIKGELTAINGNTLTVKEEDGVTISVDITNAQCRRRFGAKCDWSELAVGNILNTVGKWTDSTKTALTAKLVRDTSIQKRWGVIFGKVTTVNSDSIVVDSKLGRDSLSITIYVGKAKFVKRNEEPMTISDIQVGHRIRAKGVWDRTLKEMRETDEIKDFDLPPIVKPSPKLIPTSVPTVTPTPTPTTAV